VYALFLTKILKQNYVKCYCACVCSCLYTKPEVNVGDAISYPEQKPVINKWHFFQCCWTWRV